MADEDTIEHDDVDTTADKAAAIGKELGVEDSDTKNEVPDYDVREESDERIAKERNPVDKIAKKERPQLSNKEKRDLRKKRIGEKFNEKDAIISQQQQQIEQLTRWKSEVDTRLSGINRAEVDKAFNDTAAAFTQAEKDHAAAFTEGDGAKATAAMRVMYDAQRRIEQLQNLKTQLDKAPVQQYEQNPNQPDPVIVNRAKSWAEKNTWYNANGKDIDSEIAKAISGVLANEGYDPKSDDFWDELDDRLAERLPEKYADKNDDEDEDDVITRPVVKKRSSPPVGGNANRGDIKGKITVSLPTAFIDTLKQNGYWDDLPKRNSLIARYLSGVKDRANSV